MKIIGIIVVLIVGFWVLVFYRNKNRKESLTIMREEDTIKMFLSDDDYYEFDISDIKDDQEKIYNKIKSVLKDRSKELIKMVDRVKFFKEDDQQKEEELLNIILTAKA